MQTIRYLVYSIHWVMEGINRNGAADSFVSRMRVALQFSRRT